MACLLKKPDESGSLPARMRDVLYARIRWHPAHTNPNTLTWNPERTKYESNRALHSRIQRVVRNNAVIHG